MNRSVQLSFPSPGPNTKVLLGALVATFVASIIAPRALVSALALDPEAVLSGRLWTLVTYVAVPPADILSVVFIALSFYFFVPDLEARWGRQRVWVFTFVTVFTGGLVALFLYLFGLKGGLIAGPEPLAFAFFAAWALTFPEREVLLFFILPVKGKHLFLVELVLLVVQVVRYGTAAAPSAGAVLATLVLVYGLIRPSVIAGLFERLLIALRIKKKPKLTVVPKWGESGADKYIH